MSLVTGQCVGIDISEDFLDVYLHPEGKEVRLRHSDEGTAALLALLREFKIERVVLESTGGLQRRLVRALQDVGLAVTPWKQQWAVNVDIPKSPCVILGDLQVAFALLGQPSPSGTMWARTFERGRAYARLGLET